MMHSSNPAFRTYSYHNKQADKHNKKNVQIALRSQSGRQTESIPQCTSDHSPGTRKFSEIPRVFAALTHIMHSISIIMKHNRIITQHNATPKMHQSQLNDYPATVPLNAGVAPNVKLTINSFPWQDIPHESSPTFGQFSDISPTAVKFPHISRYSRQQVSLSHSRTIWTQLHVKPAVYSTKWNATQATATLTAINHTYKKHQVFQCY